MQKFYISKTDDSPKSAGVEALFVDITAVSTQILAAIEMNVGDTINVGDSYPQPHERGRKAADSIS